jgi:hypothetical protein
MSAWLLCLRAVADAGGGPVTDHDLFLRGAPLPPVDRVWACFWQAKRYGYLSSDEPGPGVQRTRWTVTPLGWELLQGRVTRRVMRSHLTATGLMRRSRVETVATWLRALPPANAIRLCAGDGGV